ncbi:hypothetical protein [Actinospica robiniae]|uniref:hypothetical protein n=1 Tax=Actinospica robiniae TaxID=304901 RepID=UPI00041C1796|nr:hypothetical protein [Actinospica robiniae]
MALVTGIRDLRRLPKAELHLHLAGAMRARTPGDLDRLVRGAVADAAADGVVWFQPHFSPHVQGGPETWDAVLELVLAAGLDEAGRRGIGFGLTMALPRHEGPELAGELTRLAVRHVAQGVFALGLEGDEAAFPNGPFAPAFTAAREAGLTLAPHAGELSGPESVRDAIDLLGATRLAHGVRAVEDPTVVGLLVSRGVSLDIAISSNLSRGVYRELAEHPLPALLDAGVRCSLGADDATLFGPLLGEYELARSGLGFTDERLAGLARTSLETSDAPAELVADAVAGIESWLTAP